jgi:hypothetical protein
MMLHEKDGSTRKTAIKMTVAEKDLKDSHRHDLYFIAIADRMPLLLLCYDTIARTMHVTYHFDSI